MSIIPGKPLAHKQPPSPLHHPLPPGAASRVMSFEGGSLASIVEQFESPPPDKHLGESDLRRDLQMLTQAAAIIFGCLRTVEHSATRPGPGGPLPMIPLDTDCEDGSRAALTYAHAVKAGLAAIVLRQRVELTKSNRRRAIAKVQDDRAFDDAAYSGEVEAYADGLAFAARLNVARAESENRFSGHLNNSIPPEIRQAILRELFGQDDSNDSEPGGDWNDSSTWTTVAISEGDADPVKVAPDGTLYRESDLALKPREDAFDLSAEQRRRLEEVRSGKAVAR